MTTNHRQYLDLAARLALRGRGHVEPNPCVGAVLVRDGQILGLGHHQRFGLHHAEALAIADARRRGVDTAGSTCYVTLEPCAHHGKQPPCTRALLDARVARVVIARPDPNPAAAGGAEFLRSRGVDVIFTEQSALATGLAEPFAGRVATGRPWVIAKWAQTIDGRVATRTGQSRWISGPHARHLVHRLRARVDAVLTGVGTVLADDPLLTPRGQVSIRRRAFRVVLDTHLRTPLESQLVRTARLAPLVIVTAAADRSRLEALEAAGARILTLPGSPRPDLRAALVHLWQALGVASVLVEAGPTLLGALLDEDLIDESRVYIGPMIMGDSLATPVALPVAKPLDEPLGNHLDKPRPAPRLDQLALWRLLRARPLPDGTAELIYRRRR